MTFEDACVKFSTYIIKYESLNLNHSIYLIWYTDTDNTDKLLTFKSGRIFSTTSLVNLEEALVENLPALNNFGNLDNWLENIEDNPKEHYVYDLKKITKLIGENILDAEMLEGLSNFTNLFVDFAHQDDKNKHLLKYKDNIFVTQAWEYFYNHIFWPRYNDEYKFNNVELPRIDKTKLLEGLNQMANEFDKNITGA